MPNPQATIAAQVGRDLVPGKQYSQPLPPALRPWYCYTRESGHSILALLQAAPPGPGERPDDSLVAVPVHTVLRGYALRTDGYVVVTTPAARYDPYVGLQTPPEDSEY
jgi:hypothetical protein